MQRYGLYFLPLCLLFGIAAPGFGQNSAFRLTPVAIGLSNPVDIQFPRDRSGRMFVVEQAGRIRLVKNGELQATPFLDIRSRVLSGGEQGLLAMALPPRFRDTGRFYVHYTDVAGNTVIARYQASGDTARADSEQIVLQAQQPASNHNGGSIAFGPDGYLYIGLGDGGGGNDQFQNAQNRQSLLGKLLRVDVEGGAATYSVPPTNPFVNEAGTRPEIWALGLRNPWRFSFDQATGDIWIGDVGQNRAEEIDVQPASSTGGENYGWNVMEGLRCRVGTTCANAGMVPPVYEYTRESGDISITGGYVYRGATLWNGLNGVYFFADFVSGRIWGLSRDANGVSRVEVRGPGFNVSSFGEDPNGELYVASYGGAVYRLEGTKPVLGILNGASLSPGLSSGMIAAAFTESPLTDGEAIAANTIPLPFSLGDVGVSLQGRPLPLYEVARNQVKFQIPYGLLPTAFEINITRAGQSSLIAGTGSYSEAIFPGVFSYAGSREAVIVRNFDYTIAETLEPGVDYFLYASGLGAVTNPPALGAAALADPLSVALAQPTITINGVNCPVSFAGLAPGFVALYQVNFRLGGNVPSGAQRLVLSGPSIKSNGNWVNIR